MEANETTLLKMMQEYPSQRWLYSLALGGSSLPLGLLFALRVAAGVAGAARVGGAVMVEDSDESSCVSSAFGQFLNRPKSFGVRRTRATQTAWSKPPIFESLDMLHMPTKAQRRSRGNQGAVASSYYIIIIPGTCATLDLRPPAERQLSYMCQWSVESPAVSERRMQTDDRIASSLYGSGMSTPVFLDTSIRRRWRRRRPYSFSLTPAIVLSLVLTASAFQGPAWTPRNSQWSTPSYGYTPHHGGEPHSIRLQSSATETLESEPSSSASSGSRSFTDANNVHVVDSKSKLQDPIEATVVNCSLSSIPAMNGVAETNITSESELDVPRPTDKGGYSHTVASKAKISAANKGKTPWNKGKKRSEEVRARIAAGVRAKNRERFLQNLKDMGLTEEEFNLKKKADRRRKDAERRTRRTEKGGYKPTEETKKKISQILKQKWANGEISKRTVNPAKVRRGFTHSPETRAKISESLKKRWSQDVDYRDNMLKKSHSSNSDPSVKQKISEALKKKWKNPEFRANMLEKMAKNRGPAGPHEKSHREKISAAMKAKWQDDDYRRKTLASIQKHRAEALASRPALPKTKKAKPTKPKTTPSKAKRKADDVVRIATPLTGKVETKRRVTKKRVRKKSDSIDLEGASLVKAVPSQKKRKSTAPKREADGSINRLREERRDLYELLYGDESNEATSELGDENLDSFDPYGLEDF